MKPHNSRRAIYLLLSIATMFVMNSCEKAEEEVGGTKFFISYPENGDQIMQRTTVKIEVHGKTEEGVQLVWPAQIFINDESQTKLAHAVGHTDTSRNVHYWNTSELPPGEYRIRADFVSSELVESSHEIKVTLTEWIGETGSVSDADGNTYKTVKIGEQWWMAENLATTKFNDGIEIPNVTDEHQWSSYEIGPAYCWYDNDKTANKDTFGALYNWYAVETGKVCPTGWHVASDEDWMELEMFLGISEGEVEEIGTRGTNEGSKLAYYSSIWDKSIHGGQSYLTLDVYFGTSGFDAVPGGERNGYGPFHSQYSQAYFWTSTESENRQAFYRWMENQPPIARGKLSQPAGMAVRCVKD